MGDEFINSQAKNIICELGYPRKVIQRAWENFPLFAKCQIRICASPECTTLLPYSQLTENQTCMLCKISVCEKHLLEKKQCQSTGYYVCMNCYNAHTCCIADLI